MKTSPATRDFLIDLIQNLDQADCHPILLRNYDSFPDEIGNDLDVFIPRKALARSFSILRSSAVKQDGRIVHLHRRGYFIAVWLCFPDCANPIHIDLYHGACTWHGLRYLTDEALIGSTRPVVGEVYYQIPRPAHEAMISCLASILWGGFFKLRYQDHLNSFLAPPSEYKEFTEQLLRRFGKPGRNLASDVREGRATTVVNASYARRLRLGLLSTSLLSAPLQSSVAWLHHWREEAACYLYRLPGMVVEYNQDLWDGSEALRFRNLLEHYFGATHEMSFSGASILNSLKQRRFRGKNHLLMIPGVKFRINGVQVTPLEKGNVLMADVLAEIVLAKLNDRLALQYSPV